jgi:hypothetical protein
MNNEQPLPLTPSENIELMAAANNEPDVYRDLCAMVFRLAQSISERTQAQPRKRTAPAEPKRKERMFKPPKMRKAKAEEQLEINANPD